MTIEKSTVTLIVYMGREDSIISRHARQRFGGQTQHSLGKAFPLSIIALWLLNDSVRIASYFPICVAVDTLLLDYKPGRRQNVPRPVSGALVVDLTETTKAYHDYLYDDISITEP
jgi:hypothetical protein